MGKPPAQGQDGAIPMALGPQLRAARKLAGLTLRELAGRLGVSPSLLSQIENGKSQPSVATLYALAQSLGISIDHLFEVREPGAVALGSTETPELADGGKVVALSDVRPEPSSATEPPRPTDAAARRTDARSPHQMRSGAEGTERLSVTRPGERTRLVMETGVVWEQLATNTALQLDFMEITYPPGSSSTMDERMLQHDGFEYGYVLEGEFEITLGFEVFTLRAGEAMGMNSSVPHLLRNPGVVPARGIWCVHHRHD
jgi:transcriptional regulator with XRE-family HTH domain